MDHLARGDETSCVAGIVNGAAGVVVRAAYV
jgi:hypothetical protein